MTDEKKPREYYPDQVELSDHDKAIDQVAASIGVYDEGLCKEMLALGYDGDTAPYIGFIPMIHVAWADGVVDDKERKTLHKMALARGVQEGSKVFEFFNRLINEKPDDDFFNRLGPVPLGVHFAKLPPSSSSSSLFPKIFAAIKTAVKSCIFIFCSPSSPLSDQ